MRKHKSHAVGDLCKRGVTLPSWQALEASLARDAAATPPPLLVKLDVADLACRHASSAAWIPPPSYRCDMPTFKSA